MKNIILLLLLALVFNACSTSSLSLSKDSTLNLEYGKEKCTLGKHTKKTNTLNFKDLYVYQYTVIGNEGNRLFGEYGETDLSFQFSKSELSTVMYVFDDSRRYELVYRRNNLTLAQVQMKDKKYVNVLIQANNPQDYYFVYGFSNAEFFKIANTVRLKDTEVIKPPQEAVTFDEDAKSQTNWNDPLVYFTPLIEPVRGMRGR